MACSEKKKQLLTVYKTSASERFVSLTDKDVERFVEAEANKNTQRKLHSDIVSMKSFLPNENKTRQLQDIPPPELDAYLISFLLSVRKKSDDEYEPTTLRGIIASNNNNNNNEFLNRMALQYMRTVIKGVL